MSISLRVNQLLAVLVLVGFCSFFGTACSNSDVGCVGNDECRFGRTCQNGKCIGGSFSGSDVTDQDGSLNNAADASLDLFDDFMGNNGQSDTGRPMCPCTDSLCIDNECRQVCESMTDCPDDETCTAGPYQVCGPIDECVVEDYDNEGTSCSAVFSCGAEIVEVDCGLVNNPDGCRCRVDDGPRVSVGPFPAACEDFRTMQDVANLYCSTRIRIESTP